MPLTSSEPVVVTLVPVAAPRTGVTSVGVSAKTNAPVPVSSVTAASRFALLGVARNAWIAAPSGELSVMMLYQELVAR